MTRSTKARLSLLTSHNFTLHALWLAAALAPACSTEARPAPQDAEPTTEPAADAPAGAAIVATRSDARGAQTFTRQKLRAADGSTTGSIRDERGNPVAEAELPAFTRDLLGPQLQRALATPAGAAAAAAPLDVMLILRGKIEESGDPAQQLEVQLPSRGAPRFSLDGKPVDEAAVTAANQKVLDGVDRRNKARTADLRARLQQLVERNQWKDDAGLASARQLPQPSLRRSLTRAQLAKLAATSGDLLENIELYEPARPSIAGGLSSIGVDYWAHAQGVRGNGVGVYMSEAGGGCPVSPHIDPSRFTNLAGGGPSWHADIVGAILRATAPHAHIFCGAADSMISNPAAYTPRIHVTNHSWNYYTQDRSYWAQDRDFDDAVYNNRLAVFVSAGNGDQGANTNVLTPGKAFNVFAVGNYDDDSNLMAPSSRFVNPTAGHEKPEIVAPGTNISTTAGAGTGTSLSSPFAAGFAADLLSQHTWLQGQPQAVKAMMMAGANRNIEGSAVLSDRDGAGGINYLNTGYSGLLQWWLGGNGSAFDASNRITVTRSFTAGQRYRVALDWLVSGSYAFTNNNINMDIDLWINNPSGGFVAGSYSFDNGFELIDFVAPTTGVYTVTLNRYWNSGVGDVIMALHTQTIL